jgi:hypothetical protein
MKATSQRQRRNREASAPLIAPAMVTQLTALLVLGIDPRRFLEIVRRHPELPRFHQGTKLVAVPLSAILSLAKPATDAHAPSHEDDATDAGDELTSVEQVLGGLGRRRRAQTR